MAAMRAVSTLSSCHASFECHDNFNTQCRAQLKTTNMTNQNIAVMRAVSMLSSCHASCECHDNFNTQCRAQLKTTIHKIKSVSCDVLKHECGYSWFRKVPFVSTTLACDKHSYLMPASPRVSERESYWGNWRGSRTESSYPPPHIGIKTKKKELHSKPQTDPGLKLPNNSNTCEQNLLTCSSILKLFMGKLTLS